MKSIKLASLFFLTYNFLTFGAVENITLSNDLIFTPEVAVNNNFEPEDKGLKLDEFDTSNRNIQFERGTENKISVGLLMTILRKPYYGAESDFSIYPLVEAKYKDFYIKPVTLDTVPGYFGAYNFYSDSQFLLSATAEYQLSEVSSKELGSPYNNFVETKDSELYLGLSAKFIPDSNPDFSLTTEISKNFMNSGGAKIKVYGERYINLTPDLQIIPAVSYTFLDKKYVNYFYGVPANSYGKSSYLNASGSKFGVHLDLVYGLGENISFRSISSLEILSNEISQSPLVANKVVMNIGLGLMYTF
ncbi:MAG: MipA/OmpV family protein [Fusobacteriaceae bacterium]|nr:MipA/OmpV family protein [Fusobacteriaceae bacterium]